MHLLDIRIVNYRDVMYITVITLSHTTLHDVGSLQSEDVTGVMTSGGDVMMSLSAVTLSVENHRNDVFLPQKYFIPFFFRQIKTQKECKYKE